MVGAKYNGEGPPIPKDCPATIGRLMKSCWSNLPSSRPSFEKICDTLAEEAEGWLEEEEEEGGEGGGDLSVTGASASPLGGQEQQRGRTAFASSLQELEESGLEVGGSVGSPGSGGSRGPTPSGMCVNRVFLCIVMGGRILICKVRGGRVRCAGFEGMPCHEFCRGVRKEGGGTIDAWMEVFHHY